jgi:TRAP-type C4-dicarboxylate transport system permease small subunit
MTVRLLRLLFEFATGTLLALMVLLTTVDVLGRYVFNRPLRGAFELTEVLMAALIFAALPLVTLRTEHIVVDLIDPYLGARARRIHGRVIQLASGVVVAVLAYVFFQQAWQMARDGLYTDALQLPLAPIVYFGAVAIVVAAAIHLALAFGRSLSGGVQDEPRR